MKEVAFMAEPYIGEIGVFTYNFIPEGWLACEGQVLNIQQYTPLFAVIGIKFGGDGKTNFQLPDFRNRVLVHQGQGTNLTNRVIGSVGGSNGVTLNAAQVPLHAHDIICIGTPVPANATTSPSGALWTNANAKLYAPPDTPTTTPPTLTPMASTAVGTAGSAAPLAHENLQPYLAMVFCIATTGDWPVKP